MANYVSISRNQFAGKTWQRYKDYNFAKKDTIAPVAFKEVSNLVSDYPLEFVKKADTFVLVAILSLGQSRNLFVDDLGSWLCDYVPAVYRAYPFTVINTADQPDLVCVDIDSGLIGDGDSTGEPFFDNEGQATKSLQEIVEFLKLVHQGRKDIERISRALQEMELIEPWPVTLKMHSGSHSISDLYKISEARLASVTAEELKTLRDCGALYIAYAQLISVQNMVKLGKRVSDLPQAVETIKNLKEEIIFDLIDDHGSLSFDTLK